jgi:hypothetical protein
MAQDPICYLISVERDLGLLLGGVMSQKLPYFASSFIIGMIVATILKGMGFPLMYILIICFTLGICLGAIADAMFPNKED